jgi:hypothetical protein
MFHRQHLQLEELEESNLDSLKRQQEKSVAPLTNEAAVPPQALSRSE